MTRRIAHAHDAECNQDYLAFYSDHGLDSECDCGYGDEDGSDCDCESDHHHADPCCSPAGLFPSADESEGDAIPGTCTYCNECLPCPAGIDIATVGKLYDMAIQHETMLESIRDYYFDLPATAGDCICCGVCEDRCPNDVPIIARMAQAAETFEE